MHTFVAEQSPLSASAPRADLGRMLDGGDWPRGGPMWRSGPRQIFFFLKHPPTVHSLGSALGVGRVALHRTGGRSAAAFRPSRADPSNA